MPVRQALVFCDDFHSQYIFYGSTCDLLSLRVSCSRVQVFQVCFKSTVHSVLHVCATTTVSVQSYSCHCSLQFEACSSRAAVRSLPFKAYTLSATSILSAAFQLLQFEYLLGAYNFQSSLVAQGPTFSSLSSFHLTSNCCSRYHRH